MVASQHLSIEDGDKVSSLHFYMKAKSLIITLEKAQCFIVTCERDLSDKMNIMSYFREQQRKAVTQVSAISVKGDQYFAVGLSTGELVLKYPQ